MTPGFKEALEEVQNSPHTSVDTETSDALDELQDLLRLNLNRIEALSRGPAEILPHLLLGSLDDARNVAGLKRLGVTHVLNCAAANALTGAAMYKPFGMEYSEFVAEDCQGYNIMQHYDKLAAMAASAQAASGRLFVHCEAGVNRSGTLCVAHHLAQTGGPLLASARHCKAQRGRICTNPAFQIQLFHFARDLGLPFR
mmetsp:Transcript_30125/g.65761  ORF Transcript_30125/g.65761 Transcript_30125/m.65761 type:complete len:198 (+) Transcript_30125:65-658(+)|eukprot:CAMPEP_0170580094 /NCGR_PEP_ID=MMETSP0224-20130122/6330_1 /TAXON_ID=285029 /ORGANISM="Togula jolla, Strain CCCM 725" /LENGTH=197 /DNA_ID=CAMNT_0010903155 /DNA_START=61 /DNA_END=654 /DNA_ORIENTATION=+